MAEATAHERWAPIPGFEGYEVSDLGTVRSLDRLVLHKNGKLQPRRGMILRQEIDRHGYRRIQLRGRGVLVHRLVLRAFVGEPPDDHECLHGNGVRSDNRLTNLRWGTRSENAIDSVRHGTKAETKRKHCPNGHPLSAPNLSPSNLIVGKRACLACGKARAHIAWCKQVGNPEPPYRELADRIYQEILSGRLDRRGGGPRPRRLRQDQDCA